MVKKPYVLAIISFLLIPAVTVLAAILFNAIDPEIAARHANYERNYRLLELAKNLCLLAGALVSLTLWLMTCWCLIKAKGQSLAWLLLAALGPLGLIILTLLCDNAPVPGDRLQSFVGRLPFPLRVAYELCLFAVVWAGAYELMVLKRDLMIAHQAAVTGTSTAQILAEQNASSGMWAFSEGLQVLYLVVLFYLLWPIAFNVLARLHKPQAASTKS
jgi:hypothetical protein